MTKLISQRPAPTRGFTLIEVMVTVAIVGILASIALPMYTDSLKRGRITQAHAKLEIFGGQMQTHILDNKELGFANACVAGSNAPLPKADVFTYACSNLSAETWTMTATGTGQMADFVYTLDQNDVRRTTRVPTGWGTVPVDCWILKKGGQC